ncbi:MAG: hypothetical protein AAF466_00100 [Bacteroidota bacterium]
MKKFILIVCAILVSITAQSQIIGTGGGGGGGGGQSNPISPELPQITPTTPEAGSLGRFGNVPINPATGQMSFTVPIYNISVDGKDWPVTLQYNYGGFILEEKPSLTGWGWDLNAYGSITKVVRGLPDFHPNGYYGEHSKIDQNMQYIDPQNPLITHLNMPITDFMDYFEGRHDSEVDKYILNLGGKNLSFKLRKVGTSSFVPYFLSKHNYRVDVTMRSFPDFEVDSFVVTDDMGVKYYFDYDNSEGAVINDPAHPYEVDKKTSWLLSSIELLNGQTIDFNYTTNTYTSWDFSANGISLAGDVTGVPGEGIITYAGGYNDQMNSTLMTREILDSITFPKGSLHFTTQTNGSRLVFSDIVLKDHRNITVDSYDLDYTGNRDALTNIDKNGELLYAFEYHGVNVPPFTAPGFFENASTKPWDQDYWGYFNNANNSQAINVGSQGGTANKEPSFQSTQLGAMKKITYPTGGYSEIYYGQNQIKRSFADGGGNNNQTLDQQISLSLNPIVNDPSQERHDEEIKTFDYPVLARLTHSVVGDVGNGNAILLSITGGSGIPQECYDSNVVSTWWYPEVIADARSKMKPPGPLSDPGPCDIYHPNPILSPFFHLEIDPSNGCPVGQNNFQCENDDRISNFGNSGLFWIMPGTYTFKISTYTNGNPTPPNPTWFAYGSLSAQMLLEYHDPDPNGTTDPNDIYENLDIGGIRVERIESHFDGSDKITYFYDYNDEYGLSTGIENQNPYTSDKLEIFYPSNGGTAQRIENYYSLNSFGAMDVANGVPVYYKRVKQYTYGKDQPDPGNGGGGLGTGDEEEIIPYPEGYSISEFAFPRHDVHYIYPQYPRNIDKTGATLLKEEQYDEEGDLISYRYDSHDEIRHNTQTVINSAEQTSQQDDNDDHPWSFKIVLNKTRIIEEGVCYGMTNVGNQDCQTPLKALHTFQKYREVEKDLQVRTSESRIQGVTTVTNYLRDWSNETYFVIEENSTATDGEILATTYDYPYHLSGESPYDSMETANQLSTPVRTKTFRNGIQTSQQKTLYASQTSAYKPSVVQAAKGVKTLEDRVLIEEYDSNHNVTQVRKANGEPIAYLYGYDKNYVVAEIVGATYLEAIGALPAGTNYHGNFQSLSDTDLKIALQAMRTTLSNAQVTSYTYRPLIGLSTVTDSRGYTMNYHYNIHNRLRYVKDEVGNILEEYEYNYKAN